MPRFISRRKKYTKKNRGSYGKRRGRKIVRRKYRRTGRGRVGRMRRGRIRGRGRYYIGAGSSGGAGTYQKIPTFAASGEGAVNLRHKELVGSVKIPKGYDGKFRILNIDVADEITTAGTPAVTTVKAGKRAAFRVVAGNEFLFPWGSQIQQKFESYRLDGIMFHFESLVNPGSTTFTYVPEIIMASNDNVFMSYPQSSQQMKIQAMSNSGKLNYDLRCGVECHKSRIDNKEKYVVELNSDQEQVGVAAWQADMNNRNETDHAQFYIAIEGGEAAQFALSEQVVGRLWVTYDVKLSRPIFKEHRSANAGKVVRVTRGTTLTPSATGAATEITTLNRRVALTQGLEEVDATTEVTTDHSNTHNPDNIPLVNVNAYYNKAGVLIPADSDAHSASNIIEENALAFQSARIQTWATPVYAHPNWKNAMLTDLAGSPRLFFRLGFKQYLPFAKNIRQNLKAFSEGSFTPLVNDRAIDPKDVNIGVLQHYADNIGIRWARRANYSTRFFFLRKLKPGTFWKVTVTWSGVIRRSEGRDTSYQVGASNNMNNLWITAERPKTTLVPTGFTTIVDGPMYENQTLEEVNGANNLALFNTINALTSGQAEYRNNVGWNFLNSGLPMIGGVAPTLHPDYPIVTCQDSMTQSFILRAEDSGNNMQYFDLGTLTCIHGLQTAPLAWDATASGYPVEFETNLNAAPTLRTKLEHGSRTITVEEISEYEGNTHNMVNALVSHQFSNQQVENFISKQLLTNDWNSNATFGSIIDQIV